MEISLEKDDGGGGDFYLMFVRAAPTHEYTDDSLEVLTHSQTMSLSLSTANIGLEL